MEDNTLFRKSVKLDTSQPPIAAFNYLNDVKAVAFVFPTRSGPAILKVTPAWLERSLSKGKPTAAYIRDLVVTYAIEPEESICFKPTAFEVCEARDVSTAPENLFFSTVPMLCGPHATFYGHA